MGRRRRQHKELDLCVAAYSLTRGRRNEAAEVVRAMGIDASRVDRREWRAALRRAERLIQDGREPFERILRDRDWPPSPGGLSRQQVHQRIEELTDLLSAHAEPDKVLPAHDRARLGLELAGLLTYLVFRDQLYLAMSDPRSVLKPQRRDSRMRKLRALIQRQRRYARAGMRTDDRRIENIDNEIAEIAAAIIKGTGIYVVEREQQEKQKKQPPIRARRPTRPSEFEKVKAIIAAGRRDPRLKRALDDLYQKKGHINVAYRLAMQVLQGHEDIEV